MIIRFPLLTSEAHLEESLALPRQIILARIASSGAVCADYSKPLRSVVDTGVRSTLHNPVEHVEKFHS
jgi:hypothetical protein